MRVSTLKFSFANGAQMVYSSHALGINSEFIDMESMDVPLHRDLRLPMQELKRDAAQAGLNLSVCSGYRSFEQQLQIWNGKATGLRPLLNEQGLPLDVNKLSKEDIVQSILIWSALPGASRHHWGSDFDVVDGNVVAAGYRPQLIAEECCEGGKFSALHQWLDEYLKNKSEIFFRPYTKKYKYGVAPEPWHLSFYPLAERYSKVMSLESLRETLEHSEIVLKDTVLDQLDHIFKHYVQRYF